MFVLSAETLLQNPLPYLEHLVLKLRLQQSFSEVQDLSKDCTLKYMISLSWNSGREVQSLHTH